MDAAPVAPSGGCARGVSAERFETPLAGGAAASMCASAFGWHIACQRCGGNPPAPAFPRRGKRERGRSDFLAAAGSSSWRGADRRHAAGVFALLPPFPPDSDHQPICRLCRSARFASRKSFRRHPLVCCASIRTLNGPRWARCKFGSDLKPRSSTTVPWVAEYRHLQLDL